MCTPWGLVTLKLTEAITVYREGVNLRMRNHTANLLPQAENGIVVEEEI